MARRKPESAVRRRVLRRSASRSSRAAGERSSRPGRRRSGTRRKWLLRGLLGGAAIGLVVVAWLVWPSWRAARGFAAGEWPRPSLVYGRPDRLARGASLAPGELADRLRGLGYRWSGEAATPLGAYRTGDGVIEVGLRSFPTPDGPSRPGRLRVHFAGDRIRALSLDGEDVVAAGLDPPLLGLFLEDDLRDRRPVRTSELPRHVVEAVLAAEDATFFEHPGISLSGLLRAAWVNAKSGEVQQGGSTLTQQLVKNLYLTPERTLLRKLREGVLSLLVEMRFGKDAILEGYLNEAYWGRVGGVSLMGLGAAARAWFGCEASELDVAEAALLAGMLRSPGGLDPARHPEASRARRDEVLERMHELGWLEREAWHAAAADSPQLARRRFAPRTRAYFLDAIAREARRRFGVEELRSSGFTLLTTLDPDDQVAGEEALATGLEDSEQAGAEAGLQGALLSLDPRTGRVLAWVGGRSYQASQFDRVELARRQPGSAFKPVIFAAAFAKRVATPSTMLEDAPLVLEVGGKPWQPQNVDRRFRGWVTVRGALEKSVNVATVRLGEHTGWELVVEMAHELGIEAPLRPLPALGLGALEVAPRSLATVYATLANGGWRSEPHLLRAVLDPSGLALAGGELPKPRQVISPQVAYQVAYLLQGVLDRGTAASARALGVTDRLSGKTGTTNGGRDSWFAGFSPDRATLVWVGYDDNRQSRLSGSRAALPIWARFTTARRPAGGYERLDPPPGVFFFEVDSETGGLAGRRCPVVIEEAFLDGTGPETDCYLHAGGRPPRFDPDGDDEEWGGRRRRPWWRRGVLRPRTQDDGVIALPPLGRPR
ncbi:MAG TPA: PBP1A family penicillin-binding protein [Thermoanaerobaculia bacterium]|nr:PBP1A family penicillin-binding protein [Thermoanaerobaculia bacterium]